MLTWADMKVTFFNRIHLSPYIRIRRMPRSWLYEHAQSFVACLYCYLRRPYTMSTRIPKINRKLALVALCLPTHPCPPQLTMAWVPRSLHLGLIFFLLHALTAYSNVVQSMSPSTAFSLCRFDLPLPSTPTPPTVDPGLLIFYPRAKGQVLVKCTFPSGSLMS